MAVMDFVPCPRCQEMNPPDVLECTACSASMDEEAIEVTPLGLAPQHPSPAAPAARPELPAYVAAQVAALEEQIAARPDAKGLYFEVADLHERAELKDAAIDALERLLGIDPGNALARNRIAVLRGAVPRSPPAVTAAHPVKRIAEPVARPTRPASSHRGLWLGLGAMAAVLVGGGFWLFSGPSRLIAGRSPVFSPQGDRIAFFTAPAGAATLNVYDLNTGRSRTLGRASAFVEDGAGVAWSPDGREIAFSALTEGEMGEEAVFVADAETGARRELAAGSSPTWSPDGLSIGMFCHERPEAMATTSTEEGGVPTELGEVWDGVCLVSAVDGSIRRLHQGTGNRLAFSPRSPTLVLARFPEELPEAAAAARRGKDSYEGRRDLARAMEARGLAKPGAGGVSSVLGDLFAVDADTGAMTALTVDGHSSSPRWTAEGRIVYVHQPPGRSRAELWVMGADGSGKQPLVQTPIELFDPAAVAVCGDQVVYAGPIKDVDTGLSKVMTGEEAADLHLVRPGDEAPRRLKNRHAFKRRFTLSADGRRLVYEANDRKTGKSELWLMTP